MANGMTDEQRNWYNKQMGSRKVSINGDPKLREEIVYKYSNKGKGQLREAVIIEGKPYFLKYTKTDGYLTIEPYIDEETRRLRPPYPEEYPHEPYEFNNGKSLNHYYLPLAKKLTIDEIFQKIKSYVKLFNDIDSSTLNLLSTNVVGSLFQDRLSTVHYLFIVGGNGTGKSEFGDTFECLGYRVVNITNASEAFWYRVLGSVEYGQVTIVAEEIDKLDENSQIMNMLKTGYQPNAKVPRMNNDNDKMDFYYPFCFKIMIGEKSPGEDKARGVLDRGFKINSYKGFPEFKIKEIRNPQGNKLRQKILNEIMEFRKILLIYKLIHFKDPLVEVDIGLDGRDEELCKPLLQLFYALGASEETQKEIEQTLQHFLNIKNNRKQNSREALIYPIVANIISKYGLNIGTGIIWQEITDSLEGQRDEKNQNIFHSADYGDFYRSTIIGMITDKFGGEIDHKEKGNSIVINQEIFMRMGKQYDNTKGIQTRLIPDSPEPPDSPPEAPLSHDNDIIIKECENMLSPQHQSGQSDESAMDYPPSCYYCEECFDGIGKQGYQKHVLNVHPKKPCFPGLADIEYHSLIGKGMWWEK
ncbi:MAG TPA: hypothetical protein VF220_06995 [Nitrososphaeraceae archaeon]